MVPNLRPSPDDGGEDGGRGDGGDGGGDGHGAVAVVPVAEARLDLVLLGALHLLVLALGVRGAAALDLSGWKERQRFSIPFSFTEILKS